MSRQLWFSIFALAFNCFAFGFVLANSPDAVAQLVEQFRPRGGSGAFVGGRTAPDGTEIQCDLPGDLHRRNTSSRGLGNCVFTSIHHAALWQDVPALQEFPKWLIDKGIPGGGYPGKVEKLIPQLCKDRGLPVPAYIQAENGDLEVLKLACKTGRMPCVTYSYSPTGRYNGSRISHMVNIVAAGAGKSGYYVVLDNNYTGEKAYEWLPESDYSKTFKGGGGWWFVLLPAGPPPPPRNNSPSVN